jgi:hypothetical protein
VADDLGVDCTDLDTFANAFRTACFRRHREVAPV